MYWLLANWIGHSTPLTTCEYYSLTQDLAVFSITEDRLSKNKGYTYTLKALTNKTFKAHVYKDLHRFKHEKYAYFFSKKISQVQGSDLLPRSPAFSELFNIQEGVDTIQKVLARYQSGLSVRDIDKELFIEPGFSQQIIIVSKQLLSSKLKDVFSEELFKKILQRFTWWSFNKVYCKDRIPKLTERTLENARELNSNEISRLFDIWVLTLKGDCLKNNFWQIETANDLTTFLKIYDKFNAHDDLGGCLLIEVTGVKHTQSEFIPPSGLNFALVIDDNRVLSTGDFESVLFKLKLSFRPEKSKLASCKYGLQSTLFYVKLIEALKTI